MDNLANEWGTDFVIIGAQPRHNRDPEENGRFYDRVKEDLKGVPGSFMPIKLCGNKVGVTAS